MASQRTQASSFLSDKEKDMEESLFLESNKSCLENKSLLENKSFFQNSRMNQSDSFRYVTKRNEGRWHSRSKIFKGTENPHLLRELAAKQAGAEVVWKLRGDNHSLDFPAFKTLREMCCSINEEKAGQEPFLFIAPTPYNFSLFANHCEELTDIVVALARGVAAGKGLLANNQLHLSSITRLGEKRLVLVDWGSASIRQSFTVQGRTFHKDLGPLISQSEKWLVSSEYLAPEMLRASLKRSFEHLWKQKGGVGSCDVWSLGCLLLQLITLVPLGSPYYCQLKGQERRRGLLGYKVHTAESILSRQRNFKGHALRYVRQEMRDRKEVRVTDKLMEVLPRMLEETAENRITAQEILAKLV